jgi:hypothetical protein
MPTRRAANLSRRLLVGTVWAYLLAALAALPAGAAALTEVHLDLSFRGHCEDSGTLAFYVEGSLRHEESARWGPSRPLRVVSLGDINATGPEITMRLTSSEQGVVLDIAVPQMPDDPELYLLDARVDCSVVPYVLSMPDTATEPGPSAPAWVLLGVFGAAFGLIVTRRKALAPS